MPYYEYECQCGCIFAELHSMKESADPQACPACGQSARRIMSKPGRIWCGHPLQGKIPGLKPGTMRTAAQQFLLDGEREKKRQERWSGWERYRERMDREKDEKRIEREGRKVIIDGKTKPKE